MFSFMAVVRRNWDILCELHEFEIALTEILSMGPEGLTLATISQNLACLFEINEIISNRPLCKHR